MMQYLCGQFPGRVISLRCDLPWSPRSPDLTVCDFFLWGYLKHKIWSVRHDQQPNNVRQLHEAIIAVCSDINMQIIQRSFDSMVKHANTCWGDITFQTDSHLIFDNKYVICCYCVLYR